jgi:hypothetical protein
MNHAHVKGGRKMSMRHVAIYLFVLGLLLMDDETRLHALGWAVGRFIID